VTDIVPIDTDGQRRFRVETNSTAAQADELFDSVFFAAPWHLSPMSKSLAHHFEEKIP
jgi:prenylcysteine oxidase/farnesylcysteine lyase